MTIPTGDVDALKSALNDLQIDLHNDDDGQKLNEKIDELAKAFVVVSFNKEGIYDLLKGVTASLEFLRGNTADQKLKKVEVDLNKISDLCQKFLSQNPKDISEVFVDQSNLTIEAFKLVDANDDQGAIAYIKNNAGKSSNLLLGVYRRIIDKLIEKNENSAAVEAANGFIAESSQFEIIGIQKILYYHIVEKLIEKDEINESTKIIENLIKENKIALDLPILAADEFLKKSPNISPLKKKNLYTALKGLISKGNKEELDQFSKTVKKFKNHDFKDFVEFNVFKRKAALLWKQWFR